MIKKTFITTPGLAGASKQPQNVSQIHQIADSTITSLSFKDSMGQLMPPSKAAF